MVEYGSVADWVSAVGSTGAVLAALILAHRESRRARHAGDLHSSNSAGAEIAVRQHFLSIIENACQASELTLLAFDVEQDDAAYYEQYDRYRAAMIHTARRLQRLCAFPAVPLDVYLTSDRLGALLDTPQLMEPLDEGTIIMIQDMGAQLARARDEARS